MFINRSLIQLLIHILGVVIYRATWSTLRSQHSKVFLEKKSLHFFLKKPALKKFLIFRETELSSLGLRKLLIFQEMELSYISSKKFFLYFRKKNFLKKLIFQEGTFRAQKIKKLTLKSFKTSPLV